MKRTKTCKHRLCKVTRNLRNGYCRKHRKPIRLNPKLTIIEYPAQAYFESPKGWSSDKLIEMALGTERCGSGIGFGKRALEFWGLSLNLAQIKKRLRNLGLRLEVYRV